MILAVASGKGGTGKTTVSLNLARVVGEPVDLFDCDVEEPNAHLFLKGEITAEEVVYIKIPQVDDSLCDGCGECSRFCEYNAIATVGSVALVFPEMCHGCGGCAMVCPQKAITEVDSRIGVVQKVKAGDITLIQGRLDVGIAMGPPLINAVKAQLDESRTALLDAPPGTSCPVIATLRGADYVLLVTEPTPFGLQDLTLAVAMVRELKLPFGVVINRVGIGDDRIHSFCAVEGITILGEIPEDRRVAEAYSEGILMTDALPEYWELFRELYGKILRAAGREKDGTP